LLKHRRVIVRRLLRALKWLDVVYWSYMALERRQFACAQTLPVAISDMVLRHMQTWYAIGSDNLRVLPIAPQPDRFDEQDRPRRRADARQRGGLSPSGVVALFAGMNQRLKGLEPLLHALARLRGRSLDLLVVGRSAEPEFERLVRRLGLADCVRFAGYQADMRDAYFCADFLVHPTFYDPCANVVLEAMACGLPVITTRNNGASELMHPSGSGGACEEGVVLDDPHNHEQLSSALEHLLEARRRRDCAQASRRTAAGWTFEHHYRGLLAILTEAAMRKRQAA
jgi:UDP-glucose:(heptosyl)LPS alpha-1,3-glucosyltransferase